MKRRRKRKCRHCGQFYHPDPRTRDRQQHCSAPECKRASKAWRQHRWLAKAENQDYFRSAEHVERVRRWREANPGYGRRAGRSRATALQDDCVAQPTGAQEDKVEMIGNTLQDDCLMQVALVVGLISNLTGFALQDDIVRSIRQIHARGQRILGQGPGWNVKGDCDANRQATDLPGAGAPGTEAV